MSRYFENDDIIEDEPEQKRFPQRLIEGINLKDLVNGKDVVFQINEDYDSVNSATDDYNDDTQIAVDSSFDKLRGKRGAPGPDTSFESIAASMFNVDPDGYVKKEIVSHGVGTVPPSHSRMIVHYDFYKEFDDEPFDSTYLRGKPAKLRLDFGEIIPGLELALKSMKKGESSRFLIKWQLAFGRHGCPPRIGKECDILADVNLMDYTEITGVQDGNVLSEEEVNVISFEQTIKEAKNLHCCGNEEFASGNIKSAVRSYRRSINLLNEARIANQKEEERMLSLKVKCLVNLAICFNKLGRSEQACLVCREALSIEPKNVKATFQYGKANLCLSNLTVAEKWLLKAKKMKPEDEDINKELDKLDCKKKNAYLEDTLFCQRAFSKLSCIPSEGEENDEK